MTALRYAFVPLLALAAACGGEAGDTAAENGAPADTAAADPFWVDAGQYGEMDNGRLDTVDMTARDGDAAWHVQQMNYGESWIAMTYAAWYTGPDSIVRFAEDRQPYLVDDLGNVYEGELVGDNPRIKVETGTTAIGVFVFQPAIAAGADSLTLHVNDSTPPVLQVGPFGVNHDAAPRGVEAAAAPGG